MDPMQIGQAAVILILGGWNGYKAWTDNRAKKREAAFTEEFGLEGNPKRCLAHTKAINDLRADIKEIKDRLEIV
jgi:hypothetical protein